MMVSKKNTFMLCAAFFFKSLPKFIIVIVEVCLAGKFGPVSRPSPSILIFSSSGLSFSSLPLPSFPSTLNLFHGPHSGWEQINAALWNLSHIVATFLPSPVANINHMFPICQSWLMSTASHPTGSSAWRKREQVPIDTYSTISLVIERTFIKASLPVH